MKMKLLSPAGDFESLKMAVFYGADEVYLGVRDFNARNNIEGFDLNGLKKAVDFAHIFDVKVHLTVNILFCDEELQNALDLVVEAYNIGVDAFIIQDVGLASLIGKLYPEIEMHASTQMGLHNLEGVVEAKKLGFKRVVLARETPLEEISRIKKNCDVEVEYFAQGALCVSFSGNCYLSSYLCDASGNRGKCKQLCRLPYVFEKDGKVLKEGFLLSAKDFNMIDRLHELENAGVDSIKIEGRARRPFYVAVATMQYRAALNEKQIDNEMISLAFNRKFTAGYLDGNGNIISNFQSHIGIPIGVVEKVNIGKKFNEIFVRSKRLLNKKSTFKFFRGEVEKCTISAFDLCEIESGLYRITTTQFIENGWSVNLIVDNLLEDAVLSKVLKRKVDILVTAKVGEKLKAQVKCGKFEFVAFGEICQEALKQPISKEEIEKNFAKNEIFNAKVACELDYVFLTKQQLNEFRRNVFATLEEKICSFYRKNLKTKKLESFEVERFESLSDVQIIESKGEVLKSRNVIFSPEIYKLDEIEFLKSKCEKLGKNFYLDTPNFALESDIHLLKEIIEKTKASIVANNMYALCFDTEIVVGGGLNVFNKKTAKYYGKKFVVAEGDVGNRVNFPYMTLRHCPMKSNLNATCKNCPYQNGFSYCMPSGKKLRLKRKKLATCTFYLVD